MSVSNSRTEQIDIGQSEGDMKINAILHTYSIVYIDHRSGHFPTRDFELQGLKIVDCVVQQLLKQP